MSDSAGTSGRPASLSAVHYVCSRGLVLYQPSDPGAHSEIATRISLSNISQSFMRREGDGERWRETERDWVCAMAYAALWLLYMLYTCYTIHLHVERERERKELIPCVHEYQHEHERTQAHVHTHYITCIINGMY